MIKLERGERPAELTKEVCKELTELYMKNQEKDVWNSPKIKRPLKQALLDMSHNKCVYCECMLNIESKDATIDHFLPKSINPDKVAEWDNLVPSCLRCNREKNDYEGKIVNPCVDNPQEYFALYAKNRFRLKGIDQNHIGENTISVVQLNDIIRVMTPRLQEWEKIHQGLSDILQDLREEGYKEKYKRRLQVLMGHCTADSSYAAVKATNILDDDCYIEIRNFLKKEGKWSGRPIELEEEITGIALRLI